MFYVIAHTPGQVQDNKYQLKGKKISFVAYKNTQDDLYKILLNGCFV